MDLRETSQLSLRDELKHWWILSRFGYLRDFVRKEKPKRILEMGCGTGQNLKLLSEESLFTEEVLGVDPHLGSLRHSVEPFAQLQATLPESVKPFDLLVAMDVLEHVEDDVALLQKWKESLNPGGYAFITVPALSFLWSYHDERLGHYRRYTRRQIERVAQLAGFEIVSSTYLFSFLVAPAWLIRKLFPKPREGTDLKLPSRLVNGILKGASSIERAFGGFPFFGTSVLAVVRRGDS